MSFDLEGIKDWCYRHKITIFTGVISLGVFYCFFDGSWLTPAYTEEEHRQNLSSAHDQYATQDQKQKAFNLALDKIESDLSAKESAFNSDCGGERGTKMGFWGKMKTKLPWFQSTPQCNILDDEIKTLTEARDGFYRNGEKKPAEEVVTTGGWFSGSKAWEDYKKLQVDDEMSGWSRFWGGRLNPLNLMGKDAPLAPTSYHQARAAREYANSQSWPAWILRWTGIGTLTGLCTWGASYLDDPVLKMENGASLNEAFDRNGVSPTRDDSEPAEELQNNTQQNNTKPLRQLENDSSSKWMWFWGILAVVVFISVAVLVYCVCSKSDEGDYERDIEES